jgi:outer membrane protein OmpA-like peptidoglycan-associated protein
MRVMMIKILFCRWLTLSALLVGIPFALSAQTQLSTKSKKAIELYTDADNFRVRGQYDKAIDLLNQAITKDKNFEEAYFRLGLTLKNQQEILRSCESFEKGLSLLPDIRKQNAYRYELADNYLKVGNYTQALEIVNLFLNSEKANRIKIDQAKVWKGHAEFGLANQHDNLSYQPQALSDTVNCFPMQYFPALTADNEQLIFTKRNGRGHDDDEDLFISTKDPLGRWTTPVSISNKINSNLREGASAISADGRHLIFTLCGSKTYGRCDLFESKKTGDVWSVPVNLGPMVNSSAWDVQPSLSADGQELYFVSDRKGGVGGSDIWYSRKDSTGRWMKAQNLGIMINTKYDEISPFIHVNNRNLYFASNAHPGFGGLDIFVSEKVDKKWTSPKNMGSPLNNYEDQYSFFVTADGRRAYYSKDEAGKKNDTKLFTTPLPEQVQVQYYSNLVKGKVRARLSSKPLQALVELYDIQKNERLSVVQSDSITGEYAIVLTQGAEYALYSTSPGYLFKSLSFNYSETGRKDPIIVDIELDEMKVNAKAVLNNLFFETDQYDLKAKSVTELQEVTRFLSANPKILVEIGGHTDNVGSASYNLQLSEKRAQSVATYLAQQGIDVARIIQKGYGAQQPVRPNDTEDNRQANRRIEFKILN